MRIRLVVAAVVPLVLAGGCVSTITTAHATPTCPTQPRTACGGRIIPEAQQSAGFLTYNEWIGAMTELQTESMQGTIPDRLRFNNIGQTAGGRPVYDVMITDFSDPSPLSSRVGLYFNGDIHGDERDGTEGFARVAEDLAETTDPTLADDLKHEVIVMTDANPDGWQCGDVPDGATQPAPTCQQAQANPLGTQACPSTAPTMPPVVEFTRANQATHDLNREWPVVGFQNPTTCPLTDPEVQGLVQANGNYLHRTLGINFAYGYDVHGSSTVETPPTAQLMLDVLLSAGQFDLKHSMLQTQIFNQYMSNLSATTTDNILAEIGGATGQMIYRVGEWDTSWDIYGYLVSGGYADWQANQWTGLGAVTGTIELWINGEPGQENTFTGFNQEIEASNVHSMRVAVRTAMDIAMQPQQASLALPGPIAYVSNSHSLTADNCTGSTAPPCHATTRPPGKPYPATTDQFFKDLIPYADHPITALDASSISSAPQLAPYADVVVAQDAHLSNTAFLGALNQYAQNGGIVILTDGALQDLASFTGLGSSHTGSIPSSAVSSGLVYAGYINQVAGDPLTAGMRPLGSQTYEPVPVGYGIDNTFSSSSSTVHSPAWWVSQNVWEAAGGRTAGTTGTGNTSLGEIPLGSGKVRIIGALLPDPTSDPGLSSPSGSTPHPFGVSDYAVTYVGYRLFENVLGASAQLSPPIVESCPFSTGAPSLPTATCTPATSTPEAPATALLVLAPLALLGATAMFRRRRTSRAT